MRVQFKRTPIPQRPNVPAKRVVIVSDGVLSNLCRNAEVLRRLPGLKVNMAVSKGCKCNRNRVQQTADAREFSRVRRNIVAMPPEALAFLKSMLHADNLVVYINEPKGVVKTTL